MSENHTTEIIPSTIEDAARAFLRSLNARQKSPNTVTVYSLHVNALTQSLERAGVVTIQSLNFEHLSAFFAELGEHHNRGGVHGYYRSIRAWLNWFWNTYDIETNNPIDKIRVPAPSGKALPGMPIEHFRLLVDACKTNLGARDKALLYCLLDSCARATEFVNIDIGDVDFLSGRVVIRGGKGGKDRTVRFGDRSMRALRAYLKRLRGTRLPDRQPLFVTDDQYRMDRWTLRLLLDRRADDANIPHYGLHDLRRCGALQLYRNGMAIKDISVYLGHSSVRVTELYLNVTGEDALSQHQFYGAVDNADL